MNKKLIGQILIAATPLVFALIGLWKWALFGMSEDVGAAWTTTFLILSIAAIGLEYLISEQL